MPVAKLELSASMRKGLVGLGEMRTGAEVTLGFFPAPAGVVLGQIEERAGVFREVFDEPSIEVGEPEEGLHLLLVCRSGPFGDTGNLDWIHWRSLLCPTRSEQI